MFYLIGHSLKRVFALLSLWFILLSKAPLSCQQRIGRRRRSHDKLRQAALIKPRSSSIRSYGRLWFMRFEEINSLENINLLFNLILYMKMHGFSHESCLVVKKMQYELYRISNKTTIFKYLYLYIFIVTSSLDFHYFETSLGVVESCLQNLLCGIFFLGDITNVCWILNYSIQYCVNEFVVTSYEK